MPPVLESPAPAGRLGGAAVAAGAGDQAAAAIGVGVAEPGPVSVVLGTSGVVFAALAAYRYDPEARLHTFCHARPGAWHAMGVMLAAAGSLRWLRDAMAVEEPFQALDDRAAAWPPGTGGLLFLPYLSGERTPHNDPGARAAFIGLGLEHDLGAMARAVMEGVAYGLRDLVELLASLGGRPHVGRAAGGGAASDLWLRIAASVLGCRSSAPPVRRARPSVQRSWVASPPRPSPAWTMRSRNASARATESTRTPAGSAVYDAGYDGSAARTRPFARCRLNAWPAWACADR